MKAKKPTGDKRIIANLRKINRGLRADNAVLRQRLEIATKDAAAEKTHRLIDSQSQSLRAAEILELRRAALDHNALRRCMGLMHGFLDELNDIVFPKRP